MGGVGKVVNSVVGGLFGSGGDNGAGKQALRLQQQSAAQMAAEAAEARRKQSLLEAAEKRKKNNVAASGRGATILAGDDIGNKTLLGS